MRGISGRWSSTILLIISLVGGLLTWASPANAGFFPGGIFFSFYDDAWSDWVPLGDLDLVDLMDSTAVIIGLPTQAAPTPSCFDFTQPTGSERDYSFRVDVQDCVNAGEVGPAESIPLAVFIWVPITNGIGMSSYRCWDVRGTASTEGRFDGQIRFSDALSIGSVAASSAEDVISSIASEFAGLGAMSVPSETTHGRLYGVPYVVFYLEIVPGDVPPEGGFDPEDLVWTLHVSVRRCGGETNTGLLEHYRQLAGEAEEAALPNTR